METKNNTHSRSEDLASKTKVAGFIIGLFIIMIVALVSSCKKDNSSSGGSYSHPAYSEKVNPVSYGAMTVQMTDAHAIPSALKEINVEVIGMDVRYGTPGRITEHWIPFGMKAGIYNLSELQNGMMTQLASESTLPLGPVTGVRLLFGTHNNIVELDNSRRLFFPMIVASTGASNYVTVNFEGQIERYKNLFVTLDFDAAASINSKDNGAYIMHPVIKVKSVESN